MSDNSSSENYKGRLRSANRDKKPNTSTVTHSSPVKSSSITKSLPETPVKSKSSSKTKTNIAQKSLEKATSIPEPASAEKVSNQNSYKNSLNDSIETCDLLNDSINNRHHQLDDEINEITSQQLKNLKLEIPFLSPVKIKRGPGKRVSNSPKISRENRIRKRGTPVKREKLKISSTRAKRRVETADGPQIIKPLKRINRQSQLAVDEQLSENDKKTDETDKENVIDNSSDKN